MTESHNDRLDRLRGEKQPGWAGRPPADHAGLPKENPTGEGTPPPNADTAAAGGVADADSTTTTEETVFGE